MGLELIWYAALDSKCDLVADCISQKSIRLILRFQCFFILLTVSHSLGLHFDTKCKFLLCFEAAKKTRNAKPCNMVVEFRLDLLWGPDWWQKRCHASQLEARGVHIGGQECPGKLFSLIFIGFHGFQEDWRPRLAGLWRPVARKSYPFKMMQ